MNRVMQNEGENEMTYLSKAIYGIARDMISDSEKPRSAKSEAVEFEERLIAVVDRLILAVESMPPEIWEKYKEEVYGFVDDIRDIQAVIQAIAA